MSYTNLLGQVRVGVRGAQVVTQSLLLDGMSGLIGAYSLRKLIGTWTGGAILVRRSLDNSESSIGFDAVGDLDQSALTSFVRPTITGYVLDQYSGSSVGLSLRKISGSYSGSAIRVRRSIDNAESNIGFSGDNLDTQSLLSFNENGTTKILDSYSVSAGAWSLRKLSTTYSGSSIRVRRTSDNVESDIGFNVSGGLDTTTLLQFIGTHSARVTKIYDQSGNSRDFVQPTAAWQPHIVYQGSLNTLNGRPAILFNTTLSPANHFTIPNSTSAFKFLHDGTNSFVNYVGSFGLTSNPGTNYMIIDNGGAGSKNTGFSFAYVDSGSNEAMNVSISRSVPGYGNGATHTLGMSTGNLYSSPMVQHILSILVDADNATGSQRAKLYRAGANEFAGNTVTNPPATGNSTFDLHLGAYLYDGVRYDYLNGNFQELVIFSSDQTSTRVAITSNVNYYYSNYTSSNSSFVTTWYDQSGNGRNATQITAGSQPQIVSNGSILLQGGKPSIKYDGVDDYMTISTFTASVKTIFALFHHNGVDSYDGIVTARPTGEVNLGLASDERSGFTMAYSQTTIDSFNSTSFYVNSFQTKILESTNGLNYTVYIKSNSLGGVKNFIIGSDILGGGRWLNGSVNEIIMYSNDLTSDRNNFVGNINTYYNWLIFMNNGYVKTWYDQSGLGRHATQVTNDNQPMIFSNNSLLTSDSKSIMKYDGANDFLVIPTFSDRVQTIFALFKKDITNFSNYDGIITARDSSSTIAANSNERVGFTGIPGNNNITGFENTTGVWINGRVRDVSSYKVYTSGQSLPYPTGLNLVTQFATGSSIGTKNIIIGADTLGARYLNGSVREIILYSSNESLNRDTIETGINSYYSVYPNIVKTGLILNLDANDRTSYPASGTTWFDISGYGNNGTLTNGPSFGTASGGVMVLDGIDDYINFGTLGNFGSSLSSNSITMEFAFKSSYTAGIRQFGTINSGSATLLAINFNRDENDNYSSGKTTFSLRDNNGLTLGVSMNTNIYTNNYFVVTVSRNVSTNGVKFYVNGVPVNVIVGGVGFNSNPVTFSNFQYPFTVGALNNRGSIVNYINSSIPFFRMYNTLLTDSEVLQNFNATKSRFGL